MKKDVTCAIAAAGVAALVLLSACGGGGGEGTPEGSPGAGTTDEAPDRSGISFVDNLLVKEEGGEWTRGEGLVATLRLFVGELDAAGVLRHPELLRYDGTGILEMAHTYLVDGPDAEAKAEITRLLDRLVFSSEQLEAMAGIGSATVAVQSQLALGAARANQSTNCELFFEGYKLPPGVGQCLEVGLSDFLDDFYTGQYRVFFPAGSLPQAGWTEKHFNLAVQAMEETVPVFKGIGELPPAYIVFSVLANPAALASAAPRVVPGYPAPFERPCGIAIYTDAQSLTDGDFKQVIAHELAHCFEGETFPDQYQVENEFKRWWDEGLADYLSNVAYKENNLEWGAHPERRSALDTLATFELTTTLFDRAYTNFLFFQYLENVAGSDGVFNLIRSLPTSGERPEQEAALANYAGMDKLYHDFAKAMTDGKVADTAGGLIPYEAQYTIVEIDREGAPFLQVPIKPFGVSRHLIFVGDKHAALDFKAEGLIRESARPPEGLDWSEVPEELRDENCEAATMVVVTNTEPDGGFELDVPVVLDVEGAGSLEGEWVIDNNSIREKIEYLAPAQTVDYSGEIRAIFRDDGKVEVVYDNFRVSGHSEVNLTSGPYHSEFESTYLSTTNARGEDSYEVKGEHIFYDSVFEEEFLEGTEEVTETKNGIYFQIDSGDYGLQVPIEEESTTTNPAGGWNLFGAVQKFDLRCNGAVLRFLSGDGVTAILHRAGTPD